MTQPENLYSVQGVQKRVQQGILQLDKELGQYKYANEIEKRTGVPKSYFVIGAGVLITIMIFFNLAGQLLTNTISWVYPAYASFKAIESPATDDDKQWLTYWTVIGFVHIVEYFSDILLYWFPFYYLFKTALVLWLALPRFRGAEILYARFLRPFLLNAQSDIDRQANSVRQKVGELASELASSGKTE
ncbi:ER membrane protein DP1/Yop1 [Apophysomyces ossiformis]|uniref:Protein YOP1 n=1 Tax=Apophysomyces ossiformis TaxID=679940 RepID=A0A8H7BNT0_9FUNG|nr:ER membrane protein DP1/Yop1 [Apophysomyces ossiformis]